MATLQSPFVIKHQDGAYFTIPDFLNAAHTMRGNEDAEAYLDRVRGKAKRIMGSKFDKTFFEDVLRAGEVRLPILERMVEDYARRLA